MLWTTRRGRLERDVCAGSDACAVSDIWGIEWWRSCAGFCGLYFCNFEYMPSVVAAVSTHRGYGVFVVPEESTDDTCIQRSQGAPEHWHAYLMRHVKLIMHLPAGSLMTMIMAGVRVSPQPKVMAVVAIFGRVQTSGLHSRRKGSRVNLSRSSLIDKGGPRLGPRPDLVHRVSPLADAEGPIEKSDSSKRRSDPFPVVEGQEQPSPMCSRWNTSVFEQETVDFPLSRTREVGLGVKGPGLDTFAGDRTKPVEPPPDKSMPRKRGEALGKATRDEARGEGVGSLHHGVVPQC